MTLWRISNHRNLDGAGGLRASGRWHTRGCRIIYCCEEPATALLEILANLGTDVVDLPVGYTLLKIEAPQGISKSQVGPSSLPTDWSEQESVSREIGDEWLRKCETVLLRVPTALVPESWNILISPLHPESALLRIVETIEYPFDKRLIKR